MDSSEQRRANTSEKIYPEMLFNFCDVTPLRIYNNFPPCNGRGPKDGKKFFKTASLPPPRPVSQGLNDRAPPLSEGLDLSLPCIRASRTGRILDSTS